MFFARTVAHRMDWRNVASEYEPWEIDEWIAMFRIMPWGVEPTFEQEKKEDSLSAMRRMTGV